MSEQHKGQIEDILKDLGRKIDELIEKAKTAKDEVRDDIDKKITVLKSRKKDLEDEYYDFKEKNEDKWAEVKDHLSSAAAEIKLAAEAAFKKS
ncbi:sll1863 family stress response protein [Reichenbachiella versicolor]|uniref:hypothetical protein n=1 Tax=Reichenbachiella versicolor TaxID=1821036 RepID=UPI000D6DE39C|nr:hypothetical protein [Reichenbachiella versicolor]